MKIVIETIPDKEQRYPTAGDYYKDFDGTYQIKVSDTGNDDFSFLVGLHEMVEMYLCEKREIKEVEISAFDILFEKLRESFPQIIGEQEPGDMVSAPYHREHVFATSVEKEMAKQLGIDWEDYDRIINNL